MRCLIYSWCVICSAWFVAHTHFILIALLLGIAPIYAGSKTVKPHDSTAIFRESIDLFDSTRKRPIPVAWYAPVEPFGAVRKKPLIVFSHGYGSNRGGDNVAYSYLTEYLAEQGYAVASIQHELPTDELLPMTGIPHIVRRPSWERGIANILFVLQALHTRRTDIDFEDVTLIGHSHGGDMSMLCATMYPAIMRRVISLDNRRVALPRTVRPRVYSLRSSDQPADSGVLPTPEEQVRYRITIIPLSTTTHNEMDDHASPVQRAEIKSLIQKFLRE
jgi:pimeloyl-ACP methyl ester carboxylesterase